MSNKPQAKRKIADIILERLTEKRPNYKHT